MVQEPPLRGSRPTSENGVTRGDDSVVHVAGLGQPATQDASRITRLCDRNHGNSDWNGGAMEYLG